MIIKKRGRVMWRLALCTIVLYSCNTGSFQKVPKDNFTGTWEIVGRQNLEGIQIEIKKNNQNQLTGKVKKLNDNKLVNMFLDTNDVFIKRIDRRSNFQFELVEKKIGHQLFAIYEIDTDAKFEVILNDGSFINFSENSENRKVGYKKIE